VSTTLAKLVAKFAAGVVDTGGKFAAGVVDTGGLREFSKKFQTVLMGYSGAGGKLIHKKTRSKKSRDTVPLSIR
jgi:hypothetical protein